MSGAGRSDGYTAVNFDDSETADRFQKNDPKIERLQEHVNEVSNIMQQNIDKIMERGSNLDTLQNRSEYLSNNAVEFRAGARRIQRKMWWQNMKINIIVGSVIAVIIIIIIVATTSGSK